MKNFTLKNILVLTALLLVGAGSANAQNNSKPTKDLYLSYFGNDSTNINIRYAPCCSADLYIVLSCVIYSRDTITIKGNRYYYSTPKPLGVISEPSNHYLFPRLDTLFLREERETGRLYRYYRDYFDMGETEKLICDMSLEEGDELVYPDECLWENTLVAYQVSYNNGIKTIIVANEYQETVFKEGIFPSMFPLWQEPMRDMHWNVECASASYIWLLCEYKDGVQVYGSNNNCFPDTSGIDEIEHKSVSIYPSIIKSDDIITIEASTPIKDVIITDVLGRQTAISKNRIIGNRWQISICNNSKYGVYFVLVITENGIGYEKVMVLD